MKYEFRRDFYNLVMESIENNSVTFLIGTRKCGKTVCLGQIHETLSNSSYIDLKKSASFEEKMNKFYKILDAIQADEEHVFLLDEITYMPDAEARICEIANELTMANNKNTKIVFTGSQSVALNAWANRAFAGNVGKVKVDFLTYSEFLRYKNITEVSPATYNRFLYEAADFYNFSSLEDYIEGCLEETIISNANAANYIFDNECDLIKDNPKLLINICYQTMFTLHNQVSANTFFKNDKLKETIIGTFHEVCRKIGNKTVAEKIEKSFVGGYNNIKSQDLRTLKQAFVFLKQCGLITITPIARDMENVPNVYRGMCLDDSDIDCKRDLFRKFGVTINYPMFYVQMLKDVLQEDMPECLPGSILGSIVECHARGLLPAGFELHPISDGEDEVEKEIDYVNLSDGIATELTISEKHKLYFDILPEYIDCICLTKNENSEKNDVRYIDYCSYLFDLSNKRYMSRNFSKKIQQRMKKVKGSFKNLEKQNEKILPISPPDSL